LFDRLDDLIPVARPLSDRVENEIPHLAPLGARRGPAEPVSEPLGPAAPRKVTTTTTPRGTATRALIPAERVGMMHLLAPFSRFRLCSIHRIDISFAPSSPHPTRRLACTRGPTDEGPEAVRFARLTAPSREIYRFTICQAPQPLRARPQKEEPRMTRT